MTRLRAVDELPPEWEGAAAARAALERIIAQRPVAIMFVFERADRDATQPFDMDAVPRSLALMRGLSERAMDIAFPDIVHDE